MTPAETYRAILDALKARPPASAYNLSEASGWRALKRDTARALASVGVVLTERQLQRLVFHDDMRTLWDEAEYALERHYAKRGLRVVYPRTRAEEMRVIPRKKSA